jgi:hypothetical protein
MLGEKLFLLCLSHKCCYEIKEGSWRAQSASYMGDPHPPLPSPPQHELMTSPVSVQRIFLLKTLWSKASKDRTWQAVGNSSQAHWLKTTTTDIFHLHHTTEFENLGPFGEVPWLQSIGYTSGAITPRDHHQKSKKKVSKPISTLKSIIHPKIQSKTKDMGGGLVQK